MDTPNTQPIIEIRNVSMCFNLASEKHESPHYHGSLA